MRSGVAKTSLSLPRASALADSSGRRRAPPSKSVPVELPSLSAVERRDAALHPGVHAQVGFIITSRQCPAGIAHVPSLYFGVLCPTWSVAHQRRARAGTWRRQARPCTLTRRWNRHAQRGLVTAAARPAGADRQRNGMACSRQSQHSGYTRRSRARTAQVTSPEGEALQLPEVL